MKNRIKKYVAGACYYLKITSALLNLSTCFCIDRSQRRLRLGSHAVNGFSVLIYHRVNDGTDPFKIDSVSTRNFENQMAYLSRNYSVLGLDEIIRMLENHKPLPVNCVAVTFDDGYEDNYRCAFPILKQYGLPATIFLTAGCIQKQENLWFDRILSVFKQTSQKSAELFGTMHGLEKMSDRRKAAFYCLGQLKKMENSQRLKRIEQIESALKEPGKDEPACSLLKWDQIMEMSRHGISFGSHTMSHPIMAHIGLDEAEQELARSRALIESRTGKKVRLFAYPNGRLEDFSDDVMRMLEKTGYKAALTTEEGINSSGTHLFKLKRYRPWQNDIDQFSLSLALRSLIR